MRDSESRHNAACGKQATWVRHTQFAGTHPFCTECAKKEDDFGEESSYVVWEELLHEVAQ